MESQRASDDDIIVFPGQDYDLHGGASMEDTTVRNSREDEGKSGSSTAVIGIVVSVVAIILLLCCIIFLLYRSVKRGKFSFRIQKKQKD